jgi:tetratricopeptide (TPR) repeat protein
MQTETDFLDKIESAILSDENVGKALRMLKQFMNEHPHLIVENQIEDIQNDYDLMKDFMLRGFKDPQRDNLYLGMLMKLYRILSDIKLILRTRQMGVIYTAYNKSAHFNLSSTDIRANLEGFVQDVAMSSLEPDESREKKLKQLYTEHQKYMSVMFDAILVSSQWNNDFADFIEQLLLSPTIDNNDAQLIISAIMLAIMNSFDIKKINTLINIYLKANDQHLRQRALVAWAFSLPQSESHLFKSLKDEITALCNEESHRRDLLELQIQVFYCMNAEHDNEEIQRDIIPNLLKNNGFSISKFGIGEFEDDPLQDILDPGAADRAMEEVEKSFDKMMNMQKEGSDIYFGGFSQMKRFSFFQDLSNWFCPFYVEHPGLQLTNEKMRDSKLMQTLFKHGPFCDSDKYSFALAISSVIDNLPENVREVLNSEEAIGPVMSESDKNSPAYIRRMYLQDLYRFFRVYSHKEEFKDPFDKSRADNMSFFLINNIFNGDIIKNEIKELVHFLLKCWRYGSAARIIKRFSFPDDMQYLIMSATLAVHDGRYNDAQIMYEKILDIEPDNIRAIQGMAHASFYCNDYEEAENCYAQLLEKYPYKQNYLINYCISLINNDKAEDGVNRLFKLYYDLPNDDNIKRAIGWGQMFLRKPEQAVKIYDELLAHDIPEDADYLNCGYCKWFVGDITGASEMFKTYLAFVNTNDNPNPVLISDEFKKDSRLLDKNGISDTEVKLMIDIVTQ